MLYEWEAPLPWSGEGSMMGSERNSLRGKDLEIEKSRKRVENEEWELGGSGN